MPSSLWTPALSVPLYIQYQDVLLRPGKIPETITPDDVLAFCRYLASISHLQEVNFLWRPHLPDAPPEPYDELPKA